ncbi:hypothetical protein QL093DRAFT_1459959 [Fusarium oxysporum]|nr:hypothetical protein QL093DRAFT_1459959 [Fusarium oxysporum]
MIRCPFAGTIVCLESCGLAVISLEQCCSPSKKRYLTKTASAINHYYSIYYHFTLLLLFRPFAELCIIRSEVSPRDAVYRLQMTCVSLEFRLKILGEKAYSMK